jgi:hypothetical protein
VSIRHLGWLAVAIVGAGALCVDTMRAQTSPPPSDTRAFLDRYCVTCHNDRQKTGGITFSALDPDRVDRDVALWESIVRKLRDGTMPPSGAPRSDATSVRTITASIELALDRASAASLSVGPPRVRRLNRFEYENAVRDLLAIEMPVVDLLPADESSGGFDNGAAALSVSPALMERYLSAARRISRLAVGDSAIDEAFGAATYTTPPSEWQDSRTDEDLPFGSRGIVIHHWFPLDGEYVCRIRLRRTVLGYVRGLGSRHELEIRIDGRRMATFTVGGVSKGDPAPETFAGAIAGSAEWESYALRADEDLRARFRSSAGPRTITIDFPETLLEADGVRPPPSTGLAFSYDESRSAPEGALEPAIDTVSFEGPYNATGAAHTPSRDRIFTCHPETGGTSETCAQAILRPLIRRAYRRPATDADLQGLLPFYRDGVSRRGFDEGIRAAIERLLVDPNFLFRIESGEGASSDPRSPADDVALASRLSFFLWSSIPDDELLELAAANRLHEPVISAAQVQRMLADDRASALVDSFASQWLSLRHLRDASPDPARFPEYDGTLRRAFEEETRLFVASQIRDDRSVLDLVNADYTFVNERLARFYGMAGVHGSQFRRVPITDPARRGLLGQGSILTLTSYPERTSPIVRGRWLLETLFDAPIPPPPADVPAFPSAAGSGRELSVRERTERHRSNPACANCHVRMDPLGFALEHFDPIGRWRSTDAGRPVDAGGVLPDGTRLSGVDGLRALLSNRPETVPRAVAAKLLSYALGRPLGPGERAAARTIADSAAPQYKWRSMILGVVNSAPFRAKATS